MDSVKKAMIKNPGATPEEIAKSVARDLGV